MSLPWSPRTLRTAWIYARGLLHRQSGLIDGSCKRPVATWSSSWTWRGYLEHLTLQEVPVHGKMHQPEASAESSDVHGGRKVGDKTRQAGPCMSVVKGQLVTAGGHQRFHWIQVTVMARNRAPELSFSCMATSPLTSSQAGKAACHHVYLFLNAECPSAPVMSLSTTCTINGE